MEQFKVPKKVNRHVLKALDVLQPSRTSFVSIEAITDHVRQSLRYTKPVANLEIVVQKSLRNQTQLGIVTRFGSSYAMTLAFKGLRSDRKVDRTQTNKGHSRHCDSLTADEIAKVRKMLCGVQKSSVKKKPNPSVAPKVICKRKSNRIIPARAQKASEISTPVTHHINPICDQGWSRFGPHLTSLNMDENIPKKVNRHVVKAVRHLTEKERFEFAPLHRIKIEAMWTMRNLNPVKDIESVIERSLTNLTNVGVLSERHRSYRLHCLQAPSLTASFSIFGKVNASFFPQSPSQNIQNDFEEQYISSMEESEMSEPSSHFSDSHDQQTGNYHGGESNFQAEPTSVPGEAPATIAALSSLSSLGMNVRPTEGVYGMGNSSMMGLFGSLSSVVSSESLSQERQNAIGATNISYTDVAEPMSNDSHASVLQEMPSCFQAQQTSASAEAMDMGIKPVEGEFENASLVGPHGSPFCVQLPRVASESHSQEIHNVEDSHVSISREAQSFHESSLQYIPNEANSISTVSLSQERHTTEDRENLYRTSSEHSHISVSREAQSYRETWLQSLLRGPIEISSTSSETQCADSILQGTTPVKSDEQ